MRLRLLVIATLAAPAAFAQDGISSSFDDVSAVRSFLTDAASIGAQSATVGSVVRSGDTVTANDIAMNWSHSFTVEGETATITASITAESAAIDNLAFSGGQYSADKLSVPTANFKLTLEGMDEGLEYDLTMTNYVVESFSWLPLPTLENDPNKPVSRFGPLLDWSIAQSYALNSVEKITGTTKIEGDVQDITYGPVSIGPVENGRLESFSYGPMTSEQVLEPMEPGGDPVKLTLRYGDTEGKGLDLKPLAAWMTGTGATDGPQNVLESTTLNSVDVTADGLFSMTMGESVFENFTIDPSRGGPLLSRLDPIVVSIMNGNEPNPAQIIPLVLDVYGAFGFGKYAFSDIDVNAGPVTAKLGEFVLQGLSAAGLERLAVIGLDFNGPDTTGKLGTFEVAGLVFPDRDAVTTVITQAIMGGSPTPRSIMNAMPLLGGMTVEGVEMKAPGAAGLLQLGLFEVKMEDFIAPIPTNIAVTLERLQLPSGMVPDPQMQGMMQALGADPLMADGTLNLTWNSDTQAMEMKHDMDVQKVGKLDADVMLSGIPRAIIEDPTRAQEALATAAFDGFTAKFQDQGITNFVLGMVAEQSGVARDQFIQGMAQQVQMQISMMLGDEALAEQVSSAVSTYLADPQNVEVAAKPANPVAFAQIMGAVMTAPQTLPGLLKLTVTANQ
ncbi:MAG: hypothetical protein AAGD34_03720 [Pseudomonadota bacterium]